MKWMICDIDGTVADGRHRCIHAAHPDWEKCGDKVDRDKPFHAIIEIVRNWVKDGNAVVFMTGRPEHLRSATRRWFESVAIPHWNTVPLMMRANNDDRPKTLVKSDLLDQFRKTHLRDGDTVVFAMDDGPDICDMWKARGLRTILVDHNRIVALNGERID